MMLDKILSRGFNPYSPFKKEIPFDRNNLTSGNAGLFSTLYSFLNPEFTGYLNEDTGDFLNFFNPDGTINFYAKSLANLLMAGLSEESEYGIPYQFKNKTKLLQAQWQLDNLKIANNIAGIGLKVVNFGLNKLSELGNNILRNRHLELTRKEVDSIYKNEDNSWKDGMKAVWELNKGEIRGTTTPNYNNDLNNAVNYLETQREAAEAIANGLKPSEQVLPKQVPVEQTTDNTWKEEFPDEALIALKQEVSTAEANAGNGSPSTVLQVNNATDAQLTNQAISNVTELAQTLQANEQQNLQQPTNNTTTSAIVTGAGNLLRTAGEKLGGTGGKVAEGVGVVANTALKVSKATNTGAGVGAAAEGVTDLVMDVGGVSTGSKVGDTAIKTGISTASLMLQGGSNPYALAANAAGSILGASSDSKYAQAGAQALGAVGTAFSGGSPWGAAISAIDTLAFGDNDKTHQEYAGKKGGVTMGLDMAYDAAMAGANSIPAVGNLVSALMAANKLLGHGAKAVGGGTDGMTTADAVLGSAWFQMTPEGLINGFGGKSTTPWTKDEDIFSKAGSSYLGSNALADEAGPYAGKKYGLLSSGARRKWESKIQDIRRQQNILGRITREAELLKNLQQSMTSVEEARKQNTLRGGFNNYTTFSKKGGHLFEDRLSRAHRIVIETKKVITIEPIEKEETTQNVIPEGALHANLNHMKTEDITKKGIPVIDNEGDQQAEIERDEIIFRLEVTKLLEQFKEDGSDEAAIKAGKLLTEEILYNTDDRTGLLEQFKQGGEILTVENRTLELPPFFLKLGGEIIRNYSKRDKDTQQKEKDWLEENPWFKDKYKWNGITESYMSSETLTEWVINLKFGEDDLDKIKPSYKQGGTVNVIPEGALHARKNNMEGAGEDFTHKGIPVMDNQGDLLAEIELNEIIFRLEVTKKLEELSKKENKDDASLEAGKLLVKEILYNTDDRTGLIEAIQ